MSRPPIFTAAPHARPGESLTLGQSLNIVTGINDNDDIDWYTDGQSSKGARVRGLCQSNVIDSEASGAAACAFILSPNMLGADSADCLTTVGYPGFPRIVINEIAVGSQEWFSFDFSMPVTKTGAGARLWTCSIVHQGGGGIVTTSGTWNDAVTPLGGFRFMTVFTNLVPTATSKMQVIVIPGGSTHVLGEAIGV